MPEAPNSSLLDCYALPHYLKITYEESAAGSLIEQDSVSGIIKISQIVARIACWRLIRYACS